MNKDKTIPPIDGNASLNGIGIQDSQAEQIFEVDGVQFKMIRVEGGTFTMGATSEQGYDVYDSEKPTHQVTLSTYYIGQTEVTQALWEAVMGNNPSKFQGTNNPVESVSWEDCQEFIQKLNQLTGKTFRLPTEAEWEYAARGGKKSKGYKYAGSNNLSEVAWYGYYDNDDKNRTITTETTMPVATKLPNELGLYDMSGNVWEWCQDWYGSNSSSSQTNPQGPSSGSFRVYRGGSLHNYASICRVSFRDDNPKGRCHDLGLRLVLPLEDNVQLPQKEYYKIEPEYSIEEETFNVKDVQFKMVKVQGGYFMMGATSELGWVGRGIHHVKLSTYYIGQTEVTQALWKSVMGSNPSNFEGDNNPVENVNWNDCQEFIQKLNRITGRTFRLPTEAEWEYAARGGEKTQRCRYAGSNDINAVAWSSNNSKGTTHPVMGKQANELGLYDMNGNVWEWCLDWYGGYSSSPQTNPQGPSSGTFRVFRGGGWWSNNCDFPVAYRSFGDPSFRFCDLGLRLVLVP